MMQTTDRWYLSVAQASDRLGVSRAAVYGRCKRGVIPSINTDQGIRIPLAAFQAYQRRLLGDDRVPTLVRD